MVPSQGRGCRRWTVAWTRGVGIRTGSIDTGETEPLRYKAAPIAMRCVDRVVDARPFCGVAAIEERVDVSEGVPLPGRHELAVSPSGEVVPGSDGHSPLASKEREVQHQAEQSKRKENQSTVRHPARRVVR